MRFYYFMTHDESRRKHGTAVSITLLEYTIFLNKIYFPKDTCTFSVIGLGCKFPIHRAGDLK